MTAQPRHPVDFAVSRPVAAPSRRRQVDEYGFLGLATALAATFAFTTQPQTGVEIENARIERAILIAQPQLDGAGQGGRYRPLEINVDGRPFHVWYTDAFSTYVNAAGRPAIPEADGSHYVGQCRRLLVTDRANPLLSMQPGVYREHLYCQSPTV